MIALIVPGGCVFPCTCRTLVRLNRCRVCAAPRITRRTSYGHAYREKKRNDRERRSPSPSLSLSLRRSRRALKCAARHVFFFFFPPALRNVKMGSSARSESVRRNVRADLLESRARLRFHRVSIGGLGRVQFDVHRRNNKDPFELPFNGSFPFLFRCYGTLGSAP